MQKRSQINFHTFSHRFSQIVVSGKQGDGNTKGNEKKNQQPNHEELTGPTLSFFKVSIHLCVTTIYQISFKWSDRSFVLAIRKKRIVIPLSNACYPSPCCWSSPAGCSVQLN